MDGGAWGATVHGVTESDTTEQLTHFQAKEHVKIQSFNFSWPTLLFPNLPSEEFSWVIEGTQYMFFLIFSTASHLPHSGADRCSTSVLYETSDSQMTLMVSFVTDAMLLKYQVIIHFNKLLFFFWQISSWTNAGSR